MVAPGVSYWRLSAFYLFYFATLGALIPYWGLYLSSLNFGPRAIGTLMAILMVTKIIAPNIWGWIADHRGNRLAIIRLAAFLSACAFAGIFFTDSFWGLALVLATFGFFWNAALPQFEAITLNCLGEHSHRYTWVRLWGSVGFILAVVALGYLLEHYGVGLLPSVVLLLAVGIWFASLIAPKVSEAELPPQKEPLLRVLKQPTVLAFFAACALMQASHGPYYAFYSIYLDDFGYGRGLIGQLWALGVVSEVVLFLVMHRLFRHYPLRRLFLLSFALTAVRWVLVAFFVDQLPVLIAAQVLHAASFGIYHAVAIQLVHRFFTGRLQGRGQALYSSLSFGAGGAAGSLAGGYLWDGLGGQSTYLVSALLSAVALLICWRWLWPDEVSVAGELASGH